MSKTIGQMVREHRERAGLTQLDLANMLGANCPRTISSLERDQHSPTLNYLHGIARALDITVDNLLPREWMSQNAVNAMSVSLNQYQKLAARTINLNLYPEQQANHALHGMVGEIGEIHSLYQKSYQGHPIDPKHLKKELGDLLWFIAEYCTAMGWTLEDVAQLNIEKLKARYPEGFEADKSLHRKDGDI